MKKILFAATAAAMFIGCSKDLTSDIALGNGQNNGTDFYGGIAVEASAGETTRVTVEGDTAAAASRMAWEAGDEITIAYDGKTYIYIAQNAGASSTFAPKDADNAIMAIDPAQDVAAYYNVTAVDAATKTADFAIAAEQHEGEASNKLPLYAYDASAKYADGKLVLKMSPLASIVEFEIKSSGDWNADALSLAPSAHATFKGYTSVAGAKFNPLAEGEKIDLAGATVSTKAISVVFDATKNFNGSKNVQVVVGAACFGGVPESAEGTPEYGGGAVVKLYKKGHENFRRTIWTAEEKIVDLTAAYKHVYQPLADILAGHKNGISTAEDMEAFAAEINNPTESSPVGTGFCNEDGVVVLNNDIDLSAIDNWTPINNFPGIFDGGNHCISNIKISTTERYAGLFGVLTGIVRNVTLGSKDGSTYDGTSVIEMKYEADTNTWCYAGAVANVNGGELHNVTTYIPVTVTKVSNCKSRVGGICGLTKDAVLSGCRNYGEVQNIAENGAVSNIAGIVGFIDGAGTDTKSTLIEECHNHGAVTITLGLANSIGGIAGSVAANATNVSIKNCVNHAEVFFDNDSKSAAHTIGGIVGNTADSCPTLSISSCTNSGTVHSDMNGNCFIGGIAGRSQGGATIEKCTNDGEVCFNQKNKSGAGYLCIGGICGQTYKETVIKDCSNSATIKSDKLQVSRIGGIVGTHNKSSIADCSNSGDIILQMAKAANNWEAIGGIVGFYDGSDNVPTATGCTNSGNVTATVNTNQANVGAGGIVGMTKTGKVIGNTNTGNVSIHNDQSGQTAYAGGIVGKSHSGDCTVDGNTNSGSVSASASGSSTTLAAGGVVGHFSIGTLSNSKSTGDVTCALYAGAIAGHNEKTVKSCSAGGSVNGTALTADNFSSLAFGKQDGTAEDITFAAE